MPNEESNHTLPTVGAELKKARIKLGLSTADVAANLHLAEKYIEGIEADDLAKLPQSLVFKRGYIRSYARLLKIPDEYIQRLLHAQGLIEVPVVKKTVQLEQRQITVRDKRVRWITYGIILFFVVLLISWWRSQVSLHHDPEVKSPVMNQSKYPAVVPPMPASLAPDDMQSAPAIEPPKHEVAKHEVPKSEIQSHKELTVKKENVTSIKEEKSPPAGPVTAAIDPKKRTEVVNNLNFDANG
jgi:cytoskeleton protein RodZ